MILGRRSFLAALLLPMAPLPGGRFIRTVPLGRLDGRPAPRFDVLMGSGLDARRFIDLSTIDEDHLITPADRFFVRTSAGARSLRTLDLGALASRVEDMGTHLIECAGNSDPANFGLMSTARWDGVPLRALLERLGPPAGKWRVEIAGSDPEAGSSRSSVRGASWVFHPDDIERTGAFLATRMNGAELSIDNGGPLRLVVPGWYGCTCIKWISRIDFVQENASATSQMIEFARRTHQDGQPRLAADYAPPAIDFAATPIRVEQWSVDGRLVYRVVGIVWGGGKPSAMLSIRFRREEPFARVSDYQPPASTTTWSLWSHVWRPSAPGLYRIALRGDESVRSRRLDIYFYLREARIDEV